MKGLRPLPLATLCMAAALWGQGHAQERPPGLPSLTVVADHGGEPAKPYYVAIGMSGVEEHEGYVPGPGYLAQITERDMLPVISERLTPGRVEPRVLDLPASMTPFFLIGDDDVSWQWIEQRRDMLLEQRAVGLVVNVSSIESLEQLRAHSGGIELRPVSGDDLAGRIGIAHYPVLITPQGLHQ
ncbi:integrating conjugative element protein [Billgrantia desiderata]|uniref:integrating conjugative element protein n=1 Tax=Billgrantia desiderata TaxID=52021 RepID=UPI001F2C0209|nr:integrating conjugative element protein [Halomonas desiderata]